MMNYKPKEFTGCMFNPLADQPMLEAFPRLAEIVTGEAAKEEHLDSILRYIILIYDPKSPLIFNERDINHRKGVAAQLAGFDLDDRTYLITIYQCNNKNVVNLIIKYLTRFVKSKEWAAICAFESAYWESIAKVIEPISGKNSRDILTSVQIKSAIKDEIEKDIARLEKLYQKFLGEDDALIQKAARRISPEAIAEQV
jgi:hypothetical protein